MASGSEAGEVHFYRSALTLSRPEPVAPAFAVDQKVFAVGLLGPVIVARDP
jgi:hypothetical protein